MFHEPLSVITFGLCVWPAGVHTLQLFTAILTFHPSLKRLSLTLSRVFWSYRVETCNKQDNDDGNDDNNNDGNNNDKDDDPQHRGLFGKTMIARFV